MEEALDVEWVHAMAPGAKIVLVEANSQSLADLMASAATAAAQPGVSVVSMSWGFPEGQSVVGRGRGALRPGPDHAGRPSGRDLRGQHRRLRHGRPRVPGLLAERGGGRRHQPLLERRQLLQQRDGLGLPTPTAQGGDFFGSGGGVSQYEAEPAFQTAVQSTGYRTIPDVSLVADPNTGAWIADPYNLRADNPWAVVGGTSLSAPTLGRPDRPGQPGPRRRRPRDAQLVRPDGDAAGAVQPAGERLQRHHHGHQRRLQRRRRLRPGDRPGHAGGQPAGDRPGRLHWGRSVASDCHDCRRRRRQFGEQRRLLRANQRFQGVRRRVRFGSWRRAEDMAP